jgi:hypothetical protein
MKQYSTINWYEKDIDEVLDFLYNELEEGDQYLFFEYLMQHFPDLEMDWLEIFEDFKEELFQKDKIDTILSFVEWYKLKYLNEYSEKYEFVERDLCDYFLYKNDVEKLQERIVFIQQNPAQAIDTLTIRLLYQLIYHGYCNLAVSYAETVWKPINESNQLIGFAAYPFINTIYVNQLQKCYEAGLNGIYYDQDLLFSQMVDMGFEDDKAIFNEVLLALDEDLSIENIQDSIKKGKDNHMLVLNIHFLKYMLHTYQIPFVFSEWVWNFIATTKIFGKQKGIENWFYIDVKTLDKHIASKLDTFLGSNGLEIFGKVWNLNFVFDFLYQQQLLSSEHYDNMMENVTYFRNEMIRIAGDELWQMMFVFNWPKTNNQVVDPIEKRLFNETYRKEETESFEKANRYLSNGEIPERIKKELKSKDSKVGTHLPIWSENGPYIKAETQIGRNDLCACGSGKKFKKCCMNK